MLKYQYAVAEVFIIKHNWMNVLWGGLTYFPKPTLHLCQETLSHFTNTLLFNSFKNYQNVAYCVWASSNRISIAQNNRYSVGASKFRYTLALQSTLGMRR